jgi:DNA polymerase-3 subunit alpha
MKANYPVEFMAALLSTEIGNTDKIVSNVSECRRTGITVLPPNVNKSGLEFTVEVMPDGSEAVRFGLGAVKNVGEGAARAVVAARTRLGSAGFGSLDGFCREVDWSIVGKKAVECLAKCGALDDFGDRAAICARLESAIAAAQQHQKAVARGQMDLFGNGLAPVVSAAPARVEGPAGNPREILSWEKELLGFYLSSHPLQSVLGKGIGRGLATIIDLSTARQPGDKVRLVGMVVSVRRISTRNDRTMAIIEFEDLTGSIELVAFPDTYEQFAEHWEPDRILEVTAKLDKRGEQLQLICESATTELSAIVALPAPSRTVHLTVPASDDIWNDIRLMQSIDEILNRFEGDDQVVIHLGNHLKPTALKSRKHRIEWSRNLEAALRDILSTETIRVEEPAQAS